MSDANPSLREALEKAANEQNMTEQTEQTEQTEENENVETASEQTKPEKNESKPREESVDIDPEIEEAVNFYRALKDPNQQRNIISELAQRAGILSNDQKLTKAEEKTYGQMLEEVLGEEYPDLKGKLHQVFQTYDKQQENRYNSIIQEMVRERSERMVTEFESEFSSFIKNNNVTEDIAAKMNKEIQLLPPATGQGAKRISMTQYLTKIHRLVTAEQKAVHNEVKRVEKINQNLKERSTNLTSDIGDDRLKKGSKLPSIRESVQAAAQGIAFDKDD